MSVNDETSRTVPPGLAGGGTSFPVNFAFSDAADLRVVVTDKNGLEALLVPGTDYTVAVAGVGEVTGTVTTASAVASDSHVMIYREVAATQLTEYRENADFTAKSHERALDKLTFLCQQVKRGIGQAFRLNSTAVEQPELTTVRDAVFTMDAAKRVVLQSRADFAAWLGLGKKSFPQQGMKTFANEADRLAASPDFASQVGTQQDTGQLYIADQDGKVWHPYYGTRMFIGDADQGAHAADFTAQLGVRTDTKKLYVAGSTTAGDWSPILFSPEILDQSVTQAKLAAGARVYCAGVSNLLIRQAGSSEVTLEMDEIVLRDGAGSYVRFSAPEKLIVNLQKSGVNGLDTGKEAKSTWYYIWGISNGTELAGIFSTDSDPANPSIPPAAPVMPAGYTYKLLLGVARNNDQGNLVRFEQEGKSCTIAQQMLPAVFHSDAGADPLPSTPTPIAVSLAEVIPPIACRLRGTISTTTPSANVWFSLASGPGRIWGAGKGATKVVPPMNQTYATPFDIYIESQGCSIQTSQADFKIEITGWDLQL